MDSRQKHREFLSLTSINCDGRSTYFGSGIQEAEVCRVQADLRMWIQIRIMIHLDIGWSRISGPDLSQLVAQVLLDFWHGAATALDSNDLDSVLGQKFRSRFERFWHTRDSVVRI